MTVAAGVGTVPVPDLRNLTEQQAVQAIADAGLSVGIRSEAFDPLVPAGIVVSQNPSAGHRRGQADARRLGRLEGPRAVADAEPDPDAQPDADPDTDTHADSDPAPTPDPDPRTDPDPDPERHAGSRRP